MAMDAEAALPLVQRTAPPLWRAALAGLCALLIGIGLSRFAYPPLIPALIEAHWFNAGEAGYLGATNLAGYLIGAGVTRRMAERCAATALIKGAMIVATASFVACAFPLGFAWYFLWRLVSGVVGGVLMVLAAPTILAATPPARRGRVGGVIFTGVGIGIALAGTLVPWLVRFGLTPAWLALGAASALLTLVAWSGFRSRQTATPAAAGPHTRQSARLTTPILLLMVAYAFYGVGFVPHTVFWVDYIARGLGEGLRVGGSYWVVLGIGAACGPVMSGLLAERIGFSASLRLGLVVMALGVALPLVSSHPLALAASSLAVGALGTGITSLASGRVGELVPSAQQHQVWAWVTIAFSVVYAGMGYVMSFLFEQTHSYHLLFAVGAVALLLGAFIDLASLHRKGAASS